MGGLKSLFFKLIPLVTLICCVCLGISHAFQTQQTGNITYLTAETITINNNNTPQDTTDDITIENYTFDFATYRQNIDINILKRSTTNTLDINTYTSLLNVFNEIWEDGYNFGDGVQTIINAVILAIDTVIQILNILITPIRIIAGILLTGLSLVGININARTPINTALKGILDYAAIPLIRPTYNANTSDLITGTSWQLPNNMNMTQYYDPTIFWINFSTPGGGIYTKFECQGIITNNNDYSWIRYTDRDNNVIYVYQNGQWLYEVSKTITISDEQYSEYSIIPFGNFLYNVSATEITN